ncbi:MAG TPA: hypothetical protein VJH06_00505 [Candidatus Paceibacterota bacterium]
MGKIKKRSKQTISGKKNVSENGLEDIAEIMGVAEMITRHINQFEVTMAESIHKLEVHVKHLEEEIELLRKQ